MSNGPGTVIYTSLDPNYGQSKPKAGFFSGESSDWDGDIVTTAEYWSKQSELSATAAAAAAAAAALSEIQCDLDEVTVSAILVTITDQYLGPYPSPGPTETPNGNPLAAGMLYFNTSVNQVEVRTTYDTWRDLVDTVGVNSVSGSADIKVQDDQAGSVPGLGPVTGDITFTFDNTTAGFVDATEAGAAAPIQSIAASTDPDNTIEVSDTAGAVTLYTDGQPSQLEEVTDTETGWRLLGADDSYYESIGDGAVDLSFNDNGSGYGASGTQSFLQREANICHKIFCFCRGI